MTEKSRYVSPVAPLLPRHPTYAASLALFFPAVYRLGLCKFHL